MARNHEIRIKVSKEELEVIKKKANKVSMTISSLLRYMGLNSNLVVSLEEQ